MKTQRNLFHTILIVLQSCHSGKKKVEDKNPERVRAEIKYIHMLDTHLNGLNIGEGFLGHYKMGTLQ